MRGIILALLLTLVGSEQSSYEPVFSESKTYIYNYEGLILNGLPENGLARAGAKVNCKVEISGFAQKAYLLKIISPEIKEYNGIWPKDPFTRSTKLTQALAAQLSRPVKFEYSNGRVGVIYAPEDVSETVVNLYRGILNMLQLTIKKSQNVYDLQEAGVTGVCHTRYVIQEDKRSDRIIVIKSRDLNNCQEKVVKNIGMAYMETCNTCQQRGKNLRGTATYTYKMKNKAVGAMITEVTARQVYHYSPFYELYGAAVMEARQVLTLVDSKSNHVNAPLSQLKNRGGLLYNFASEVLQMPVHLTKTRSSEAQMLETLQHLVQNNQQQVHTDAPARFLQLAQALRRASIENIQSLWKQFAARPQYRRWLLNAIPVAGTVDSLKFIKQSIHNQDMSHSEGIQAIVLALQFTKADHQTLQIAADLITDTRIQKSPALYKAAVLAYGSMVNKYCSAHSMCPEAALEPLHNLAAEAGNKAHEEDMTLALKALGNAGQPASIKRIQKFLPGFSSSAFQLPVRIQTDAVMALRNIAKEDPKRVQDILIQIFMDRRVRSEVRMIACVVLFETKPRLALVTTIANVAVKESKVNLQLSSFTYSHMKALSKSRVPELHQLAAACSVAIKILNPALDRLSYRYSKAIYADTFKYPLMAGAGLNAFIVNSANTMFPVFLLSKVRGYFTGAEADILEVAVRAEGLEETLRKQNIPFAEYPMHKKISQIAKTLLGWKGLPSEVPLVSAYIKLFGQEVAFAKLNKEVIQSAIKALNEPAERHSLVKNVIQKLLNGVEGQVGQPVLAAEVRHIVPTLVGLPIEFSFYATAVANAAINTDIKVTPSPSSDFSAAQLLESNIQLHADIAPSVAMHAVAVMGINTHLIQAGIEFHAKLRTNAPMKFTAKIDMKAKNIKIETTPCQQENELFVARAQAFAVTRNVEEQDAEKKTPVLPRGAASNILRKHFDTTAKTSTEAASMMEVSSELVSKKYAYSAERLNHHAAAGSQSTYHFCAKSTNFGFQVCLESQTQSAAFLKDSPLYRVVGEHEAKVVVKPARADAAIEKLLLEIQAGPRAASKIITLVSLEENEEHDDSVVQMKLKKILGIGEVKLSSNNDDNTNSSSSSSSSQKNRSKANSSSSSSSSNSSSSSSDQDWKKMTVGLNHKHPSSSSSSSSGQRAHGHEQHVKDSSSSSSAQKAHGHKHHAKDSSSSSSAQKAHGHKSHPKDSSSSSSAQKAHGHKNHPKDSSSSSSAQKAHGRRQQDKDSSSSSSSSARNTHGHKHQDKDKGHHDRRPKNKGHKKSSSSSNSSNQGKDHRANNFHQEKNQNKHSKADHEHKKNSSNSRRSNQAKAKHQNKHSIEAHGHKKSSSSSSQSSRNQHPEIFAYRFKPANRRANPNRKASSSRSSSQSSSSSSSSGSSARRSPQRPNFMGDSKPPVLAVTVQAVRSDNKKQGYQLIVYADYHASKPQMQAYVVEITGSSRWRACADAVIVNSHEAQAYLKWGRNCQDYKVTAKAEMGHFGNQPGLRVKLEWPQIPSRLRDLEQWAAQFVPGAAYMAGFAERLQRNPSRQARIILSLSSARTFDAVIQVPRLTLYYRSIQLPVAISAGRPIQASDIQAPSWSVFSEAPQMLMDSLKGHCMVSHNSITTFNKVKFNYSMPGSCYHVLAQDCSPELKFLVMMKTAEESPEYKAINVKLGSYDIDMHPSAGLLKLIINGIHVDHLPYQSHAEPFVMIEKQGDGLSLMAPDYGIEKLYYDGITVQVAPALWMKAKTCGVCGRHDDEKEQEYQMPNGFVAKDEESFAHSWILPEVACSGACKLQHTLVKLEKHIRIDGEDSKCYSRTPVLRCVKGCSPTKTTHVSVGFHCLPADATLDLPEGQVNLEKSEDLVDTIEAHTACSCSALQCAA